MYQLLLRNICEVVDLTPAEQKIIEEFFTPKKLKKRQFLLQEGNTCSKLSFVSKGKLVSYSTDEKRNEHVISFSFEGWWAGDMVSLLSKKPSTLNIEALEPCELLQLDVEQQDILFTKVPAYERFVRIKYQDACIGLQNRIESSLGLTAEEKYNWLVKQSPSITGNMPLNLIASYLGVTPATISRVRKRSMQTEKGILE